MANWHTRIASAFARNSDLDFPSSNPSSFSKNSNLQSKMKKALNTKKDGGSYAKGKWYVVKDNASGKLLPAFVPLIGTSPQFTTNNLLVAPCPPYCPDQSIRFHHG